MSYYPSRRVRVGALAALCVLALGAGCGNNDSPDEPGKTGKTGKTGGASDTGADTQLGNGDWLVAVTTAGGSDAEKMRTTYLTYNPATGETSTKRLPGVMAGTSDASQAALLVSADRKWAIPNTTIGRGGELSGKLTVFSLADNAKRILDVRKAAGKEGVRPIGWAFDPQRPDTLRVVDTHYDVWAISVTAKPQKATKEKSLPSRSWVFTNKFDPNTGKPFVESIDSDQTRPAGHEDVDTVPVQRAGGAILAPRSKQLKALPKTPCGLAIGFAAEDESNWLICADGQRLRTYVLSNDGDKWQPYGKPSESVVPEVAALPLVLPPE